MSNGKIIVVGGGAAGLMAAGQAAAEGAEVTLVEKMNRVGKKIAISGKGRCNVTNAGEITDFVQHYPGNGKFLYASLNEFSNEDLIAFLKENGVETKTERGGRVFPVANEAEVIVTALEKFLKKNKVEIILGQRVKELIFEKERICGIRLANGEKLKARAVIIATGGASYPGTGSTGDGYELAKMAGHRIIDPFPALVPLKTSERWPRELQGLTLKNVEASIWVEGQKKATEFGELLFTHFGLSGPIILTLSRIAAQALKENKKVRITINLKPALSSEQLDLRLQRDFKKYQNKQFKNSLNDLLPKSLIPVIVSLSEIPPEKAVHQISKEERRRLGHLLQELGLTVTGTLGLAMAIVTAGGVDVKEINPSTMESRLVKGLYFAGEVIDVDGVTGGYNLQAAFATGFKAGRTAAKTVLSESV